MAFSQGVLLWPPQCVISNAHANTHCLHLIIAISLLHKLNMYAILTLSIKSTVIKLVSQTKSVSVLSQGSSDYI